MLCHKQKKQTESCRSSKWRAVLWRHNNNNLKKGSSSAKKQLGNSCVASEVRRKSSPATVSPTDFSINSLTNLLPSSSIALWGKTLPSMCLKLAFNRASSVSPTWDCPFSHLTWEGDALFALHHVNQQAWLQNKRYRYGQHSEQRCSIRRLQHIATAVEKCWVQH